MNIEIIAIGNEVLGGFTVNTNAAFISKSLLEEGFRVNRHMVLPDEEEQLRTGLKEALNRSDLVICTGGLGPTCDDITRKIAAQLFDSDFHYDHKIAEDLKKRFGDSLPSIIDQATLPSKAGILKNTVGTASGLIFKNQTTTLVLLPGVPPEMRAMWINSVLPYVKSNLPEMERYFYKKLYFIGVLENDVDKVLRQLQQRYSEVEFGIYPEQMILSVQLSAKADNFENAMAKLKWPYEDLKSQFSSNIFEAPSGKIEDAVHQRFLKKKSTLAIAESCTGGALSARLTKNSGASQYFLGSFVVYSNELKSEVLGVSEKVIQEKGAVSRETVEGLLKGLFTKTACDYGVAVSGVAGPSGGTSEKPVGTIWCAVGKRGTPPIIWQSRAYGNRETIIEGSVNIVLGGLLKILPE